MTIEFTPFPKITNRLPRGSEDVKFWQAYVKLHGTNAAIHVNQYGHVVACQSRNRLITPDDDNLGFARSMYGRDVNLRHQAAKPWIIYGEWAGQGIQKGVGISNIEKQFFPFAISVCGVFMKNEVATGFIRGAGVFSPILLEPYNTFFHKDMEGLQAAVEAVDKLCPVARVFGFDGHGEGFVLRPHGDQETDTELWWKAKGASHQKSDVKVFKAPEFGDESREWIQEQIQRRAAQGLAYLQEMGHPITAESTPLFIKWMVNDITTEEDIPDFVNVKAIGSFAAKAYKELA